MQPLENPHMAFFITAYQPMIIGSETVDRVTVMEQYMGFAGFQIPCLDGVVI